MAFGDKIGKYAEKKTDEFVCADRVSRELFEQFGVKKGLRDENGKGVVTGLTNISSVVSFHRENDREIPCDGELRYRGYDIHDLIRSEPADRFCFEEVTYLLLFGSLPDKAQLREFRQILQSARALPTNFTRDVIMKAPSDDIMSSITRSVLTLASYDEAALDISLSNVLRQSVQLISIFPMLAVYGYQAYNHYVNDASMYIHRPEPSLSTAENLLGMLRPDRSFTQLEAKVLETVLILHMEHGGGNNSTFTTRVVTSSGADTYAAISAALSSLKGPKHGGANLMVMKMMDDIRAHVSEYGDEDEINSYLDKLLNKQAFDGKGLIYGMGHAVYSLSDPRERVLRSFVEELAEAKGRQQDMRLYSSVERLAPQLIARERKIFKGVSPNVDFYSGFVYDMLGIPTELYTPLFAVARIVGWSAHRMEELVSADKIIRPAYKTLVVPREYVPIEKRGK